MKKENVKEDRLDRIERGMEAFFRGMAELRESQRKTDAQILELKESQKKTDEQLEKTDKQLRETIKKLDEIGRQLGDLGLVQGETAEDLFYRNLRSLFKKERDLIF